MLRKESMKTSDKLRLLLVVVVCIFLLLQIGAGIFSCTEFNKANTHSVSLEYDCFSSTAVSQVNENAFSMPLGPGMADALLSLSNFLLHFYSFWSHHNMFGHFSFHLLTAAAQSRHEIHSKMQQLSWRVIL